VWALYFWAVAATLGFASAFVEALFAEASFAEASVKASVEASVKRAVKGVATDIAVGFVDKGIVTKALGFAFKETVDIKVIKAIVVAVKY
jgi:hypothetical protein